MTTLFNQRVADEVLEKKVERKYVIHFVGATLRVDVLVEVSDFGAQRPMVTPLVANTKERPVLVESCFGTPIGIVEVEEYFVPGDQRPLG